MLVGVSLWHAAGLVASEAYLESADINSSFGNVISGEGIVFRAAVEKGEGLTRARGGGAAECK